MKLTHAAPAFIAVFLFGGAILGQTPKAKATPDFNGRWRTEKVQEMIAPGLPPKIKLNPKTGWEELVIIQKDAVLTKKMTGIYDSKPYSIERTFYTDERGETNSVKGHPEVTIVTKTWIKKDALVTEGYISSDGSDAKNSDESIRDEIRLSKDGKELKVKHCSYLRILILKFPMQSGRPDPTALCAETKYARIQ